MKATDLMIGDYIQDLAGYLCQVIVIDRQVAQVETLTGVHQGDTTRYLHEAEGVPLTPEILEMNYGKETRVGISDKPCWGEMGAIWSTMLWKCENSFWLEVSTIAGGFVKKHIRYVHELQHALRLLGVEKEIEL